MALQGHNKPEAGRQVESKILQSEMFARGFPNKGAYVEVAVAKQLSRYPVTSFNIAEELNHWVFIELALANLPLLQM